MTAPKPHPDSLTKGQRTLRLLPVALLNGINYLLIGLPLAVFPSLVHFKLGYSAALAGAIISLQYAATLVSRSLAGRISDTRGAKTIVIFGLVFGALNGLCILIASFCHTPLVILLWLGASRLLLGIAESGTGTGCVTWNIGRVGSAATAEVISWNGVSSYGGIAAGAPLGVLLAGWGGLHLLGAVAVVLPLIGLYFTGRIPAVPPLVGAVRMSAWRVVRQMTPYGLALAGGSFGFGIIVAFMALYYVAHGWEGASLALTAFGVSFVLVRIVLAGVIGRFGGFRAALVSFMVEAAGLALIWLAPAPLIALLGASLAGFGFSLVFPALAVEALHPVAAGSRGAAIGIYTVFMDIAMGLTGPLAGLVAAQLGYPTVFLLGLLIVLGALTLTWKLRQAVLMKGIG